MKKRSFALLNKVVFFYLLITLVTFVVSALILQSEANKHMDNILETRFKHREWYVQKLIKKNPEKLSRLDHTDVKKIEELPTPMTPTYQDTTIYNEQTEEDETFRKKTTYTTIDGEHYKVEISKEAGELYNFRDDVFQIIMPIFGLMVVIIVLANYLLSGYFFGPFRKIMKEMASYKLGKANTIQGIQTTTHEFQELIKLYNQMQRRIENDYYQLKEYTENMSHELQTPLSIIQNKTESLLSENKLTQHQAQKVKVIYNEIQQLSRLGSALNLITKIENNEFRETEVIKTAPVIRDHANNVSDIADMKDLQIKTDLDEEHQFSINPSLFDILIRNLLKNALHYSYSGTTIQITTGKEVLEIRNQGEELDFPGDEIFDRFKRGKKNKSIGLGLAIVKKICKVHNLNIEYTCHNQIHSFKIYPLTNSM
ncbi:MAG: sensor histidine kinase [Bacteroidota bacterium]